MSHVVSIQARVRDLTAIAAACHRLSLAEPVQGTAELFSGQATGIIVRLPGWTYPVVFNSVTGDAKFDDYEGKWGNRAHFEQFLQIYAVERAKIEARKKGYSVTEQTLHDGSIRVQVIAA